MSPGMKPGPGLAIAPTPPGRLGEACEATVLLGYLRQLGDWVTQRRRELDGIDAAAARSSQPDDYTADVTLSMTLWQSVNERFGRLERLWDSGRADPVAREQMSQVIWGRLAPVGAVAVGADLTLSVAEACRLSDALAGQLRARLAFDPRAADDAARVTAIRSALERLRELVKHEPSWAPQVELLSGRVDGLSARAARGGDVGSALHTLEADAARVERDLVVTTATKLRQVRSAEASAAALAADRARAATEVAALQHRRAALLRLVERCRTEVASPPQYAVPNVATLGTVPQERTELDVFTRRLGQVVQAMDLVEQRCTDSIAEREELIGLFSGYRSMAERTRRTRDDGDTRAMVAQVRAEQALAAVPCDVADARAAVSAFRDALRITGQAGGSTGNVGDTGVVG